MRLTPCSNVFPIRRSTRWHRRISVGRAVNAWLAELGDATLDALREKLRCRRLSQMVLAAWRSLPAAWPMPRQHAASVAQPSPCR